MRAGLQGAMLETPELEAARMVGTASSRPGPGGPGAPASATEELIEQVDVHELSRDRFLRVVAPHFAEEIALGRRVRQLLAGGAWEQIHVVPHRADGAPSDHLFDLYGVPRAQRTEHPEVSR
jgi:hypothetical protein